MKKKSPEGVPPGEARARQGEAEKQKKKVSKVVLKRDEEGNIVYPIRINSSLSILNLGRIEYERPAFHSERNLFPIGFKSLREHQSIHRSGERVLYECEI